MTTEAARAEQANNDFLRTIAGGLGVLRGFKIWRHRAHVNKNSAESIMELMTNEGVIEAARKVAGAA